MAGTPLATAFVRILPEPGFGVRLREEAALSSPTITPKVNTAPAEGQLREFISGVGGKLLGALAIGEVLKSGFEAQANYQKGLAQLEAGLKSTGDVAGVTADDMEKLADKISGYSGQNRNAIVASEQMLISFTNIRDVAGKNNDILTQSVKISADLAARFGGSASDSAIKLGKALNDPVKGLTALTRVGVTFDAQQKELIKTLVASGDTLDAQKVILAELNKEFGGSAKAVGSTLSGEVNKAKNAFEEFSGEIVGAVAPALDIVLKAAVEVGKAFFGGVHFLTEHKDAVLAVVAAYATLKFEAVAGAIIAGGARIVGAFETVALKALYAGDAIRTLGSGSLLAGSLLGGAAVAGVGLLTYAFLHMGDQAKAARANVDSLTAGLTLTNLPDIATGISRVTAELKKIPGGGSGLAASSALVKDLKNELRSLTDAQEAAQGKIDLIKGSSAQLAKEFGISTGAVQTLAKAYHIDLSGDMDKVTKQFDSLYDITGKTTDAQRQNAAGIKAFAESTDKYNVQVGVTNKALGSQIDLLAGVASQSKLTGAQLLQNAKDGLKAFQDEATNIQALTRKHLDPSTIKALVDKGPEYVAAANALSVQDLKTFGATYQNELKAQWGRSATVTALGATAADRKAIDAIIAGQGAMDGATGKIAASITTAFLHEHPKAYAAAHDLYFVVQTEVDKLHGKTLQILLDDQASGNLQQLSADLAYLTQQINGLPPGIAVGIAPLPAGIASPSYNKSIFRGASGALLPGYGGGDRIPALLEGGEAVIPKHLVPEIAGWAGAKGIPGFAAGGLVDRWRMTINDAGLGQALAAYDGGVKNSANLFSGAAVGGGSQQWAPLVLQVLAMLGQSASWLPNVLRQINTESGGNPNAINNWDSNAALGQNSRGLLQTIPSTFAAYAGKFAGLGIFNPEANVFAALNYAISRYGSLSVLGQGHGYDNGGPLMPGWTMAYNGTGKPENVQTAAQAEHGSRALMHVEHQYNSSPADVEIALRHAEFRDRVSRGFQ